MATDDLFEALRHLPDQVRDAAVAAAVVEGLPAPGEISEVVIVGAGGGGVAGDVVESVAHLQGSEPVLATGGISPAWLSESSLVVAVSQSGDDQPTVAAARVARDQRGADGGRHLGGQVDGTVHRLGGSDSSGGPLSPARLPDWAW